MTGLLGLVLTLVLLLTQPLVGISVLVTGILGLAMTTAFMAKSVKEFFILAPLHLGSILAYGFGALRGIYIIWKKRRAVLQA
jgi:hypothetical protein